MFNTPEPPVPTMYAMYATMRWPRILCVEWQTNFSYLQTGRNRAPVVEERDVDKSTGSSVGGFPSASSSSGLAPLSPPKVRPQASSRLADLPVPPPPTVETILQVTSTSTPPFHRTQL